MTTAYETCVRRAGVVTVVFTESGLGQRLAAAGDIVVVAEAGEDAVKLVVSYRPDVLVLDPQGPGGVEAIGKVRCAAPGTAVLALSAADDNGTIRAAMRAGARGYLVKGADEGGLVDSIRGVAAGGMILGASIAGRIATLLAPVEPLDRLTVREREIHDLYRAGASIGTIAQRLRLAPKTVRNHLSSIVGKLHATDRTEVITHQRRPAVPVARRIALSGHYPRPKPSAW
jgi:DNA-binding NarL/FixJ family response regulator